MMMGLVSRLSLANHSDAESFLVVHALFGWDECQREGFWEVVGHVVSPFDLSWTLLVPCSLLGPPVIKQLMQIVTMVPGQGGWFASPNKTRKVQWRIITSSSGVHVKATWVLWSWKTGKIKERPPLPPPPHAVLCVLDNCYCKELPFLP